MNRFTIALATILAVGCSAAENTGNPPPVENVNAFTLDDYLAADRAFGCLSFGCVFGIAPSELPAFCGDDDGGAGDKRAGVAAGRLRFDAERAKACVPALREYQATACWGADADFARDVDGLLAKCAGVLVPLVPDGGDCVISDECATGFCDATKAVCPGKCAPKRPAGGACDGDAKCAEGLACRASKCVALAGPGEACAAAQPCRDGLFCSGGTCAAPLAKDAACDPDDDHCAAGLYCAASKACAPRLAAGAPCDVGSGGTLGITSPQCAGNQVCVGLVLDGDGFVLFQGTCGAPSDAGGACAPPNGREGADEADSGCFLGITCDGATSKCRKLPVAGEACVDLGCVQTAYCDAGSCHALKADGEACGASAECLHSCTGGKCAKAAAAQCHAP